MAFILQWLPIPPRSVVTGVDSLSWVGLQDVREILIEIEGLQHNSGTPDYYLQLTADDGSTWDTTNYIHYGATGTAAFIFATAIPVTTSVGALIQLFHFNETLMTTAKINGGRHSSSSGARAGSARNSVAGPWTGLRITNSGPTNWTANGGVRLFGRQ